MSRSNLRGIISVVLSAIIFGFSPIAAKFVYSNGGTPFQVLYARYFSLPFLFFLIRIRKIPLKVTRRELGFIFILGILGSVITALTLLYAYVLLPSGTATTLHFLYCVLISIGCVVFFKEKLTWKRGCSVIACTIGVCLLSTPESADNVLGVIIALISAIAYAAYSIILDKSGMHNLHPLTLTLYTGIVAIIFLTVYAMATNSLYFTFNARGWLITIIHYIIFMQLGGIFYMSGIHHIGAQYASILSTLEPLTSVIVGILIFKESFDAASVSGIILIIGGTITVMLANNKTSTPVKSVSSDEKLF